MTNIIQALLLAFAMVESSNREQIFGDNGKAWGLYQFHETRWIEFGGKESNWGKAPRKEQDQIMAGYLIWAQKQAKKRNVDFIQFAATYHNNGHFVSKETGYVRKIRKQIDGKVVIKTWKAYAQ